MKLNLRIASLLVIGIFGISSSSLAQTNKKTTNKAQPNAEANANSTKETKPKNDRLKQNTNINLSKSSKRPASTGTALTDYDWIARSENLTADTNDDLRKFIENNGDNGGANGARAKDFAGAAFGNLNELGRHYKEQNGNSGNSANSNNYDKIPGNSLDAIKSRFEQALTFYDKIEYEHNGLKASAKNKLEQAIRQLQSYMDNLPAGVRKNQSGSDKVKSKSGSNLRTSQTPVKPSKNTNAKPKTKGNN